MGRALTPGADATGALTLASRSTGGAGPVRASRARPAALRCGHADRLAPRRAASTSARTRSTRSRTAPPNCVACPGAPLTTNAASRSRASPMRRTAIARDIAGAPSSTTRAKAPLRRRTSAHQAPRAASVGRTTTSRDASRATPQAAAPPVRSCASGTTRVSAVLSQSRGSRVHAASTIATEAPCATVAATRRRSTVVRPLPAAPTSSVRRPRGSPPARSRASSAGIPVGRPGAAGRSGAAIAASCWRRSASDDMAGGPVECAAREERKKRSCPRAARIHARGNRIPNKYRKSSDGRGSLWYRSRR